MDFFGNDGTLESIQTMGIVNSLKTGNVLLDMTIAMMIPIVLGMAFSTLSKAQEMLSKVNWLSYFRKPSKQYSRSICHKTIQTPYSTVDMGSGDSQNETLIKAIQLYLHHHNVLQKLSNAKMELQSFGKKEQRSYYYDDSDSKSNSFADTLSKYQVVKKPYSGAWISLGNFKNQVVRRARGDENTVTCNSQSGSDDTNTSKGKTYNKSTISNNKDTQSNEDYEVDMVIEETKLDLGDGKQNTDMTQKNELTLRFRSDGKHSIDNFIDTAYEWYLNELRKMEDDSRYLYELIDKPSISSSSDDGDDNHRKYKRYMLSDEKTFDSLFFQEKNSIVKLVDHFVNKTGKYAIKGYPNKLGLLLHGPPGTGKTSLIKALAQYTNRSIVNVPLARISTNAELSSLFFDQKYFVDGERVPVNLNFKDVIFVMEDVDAVSKIVRRRDGKKASDVTYREPVDLPTTTKSMWKMLVESTNSSCKELVKLLKEKSERLAAEAKQTSVLCNAAKKMSVVPGINYVGQDPDNAAMKAITEDALKSAQQLMNEYHTVDTFLGTHAESLKQMIEGGTEISTEFENELLGLNHTTSSLPTFSSLGSLGPNTQSLSREVSITQDQEQDAVIIDSIKGGFLKEGGDDVGMDDDDLLLLSELKDEKDVKGGSKEKTIGPTFNKWKKDELNLSGLLNVLDGVVDTPGRMLIMTTNHPEVLDPALIRPGRIDKKLLLSYMKYQDIASMIEHYFQTTLSQKDVERLRIAINGDAGVASTSSTTIGNKPSVKLTPAQVEQMAAEYDEVDEMISAIENKSKSILGRHQFNRVPQVTFDT